MRVRNLLSVELTDAIAGVCAGLVLFHLGSLLVVGNIFQFACAQISSVPDSSIQGPLIVMILATGLLSAKMKRLSVWHILILVSLLSYTLIVCVHLPATHNLLYAALCGLTPIALAICLPAALNERQYKFLFWSSAVLLLSHSLINLFLIVARAHSIFGYNVFLPHGRLICPAWLIPYTGGLFGNPNTLASYLMFFPAILAYLWLDTTNVLRRILIIFVAFVLCSNLALTLCRAAIFTAILSFVPLVLFYTKHNLRKGIVLVSGLVVVTAAFLSILLCFTTLPSPFWLSGRELIWKEIFCELQWTGLFGTGLFGVSVHDLTPHSFIVANLAYFGWLGLISLLCALSGFFCLSWRDRSCICNPKILPITGAIAVYLVFYGNLEYVFTYPAFFSNSLGWLLIGFLCNFRSIADRQLNTSRLTTYACQLVAHKG